MPQSRTLCVPLASQAPARRTAHEPSARAEHPPGPGHPVARRWCPIEFKHLKRSHRTRMQIALPVEELCAPREPQDWERRGLSRCNVGGSARARALCVECARLVSLTCMLHARAACTAALMMPCMLTTPARPSFAGKAEMASGGREPTLAGATEQLAARLGSYVDRLQLAGRCGEL